MIRFIGFVLLVTAWTVATSFADHRPPNQLQGRAEVLIGNRTYQADIYDPDPHNGGRLLQIRCIEGCREEHLYIEEIDDPPNAIFHLAGNFIISIWTGGSVSRVRVHHIGEKEIKEVLVDDYRGAPEFSVANDYRSPVIVVTSWNHPLHHRPPIFRTTWRWSGKEYKMSKRCIENCWPRFFGD